MKIIFILFVWWHGHPYPRLAYAEESLCWADVRAVKAKGVTAECRIAELPSRIGG